MKIPVAHASRVLWFRRLAENDLCLIMPLAATSAPRKVRECGTHSPARETRALPGRLAPQE
ncbi:MAG: hypothetical protein DLM52_10755 [Chthoniobacterales bacterium]|nr:MAG: hypothetical protein DLM52_10755 [Chthoniobacterales bacterium]